MLVPTRELARHTCSVVKEIGKHMNIQCMAAAGETSLLQDVMQLHKRVHVVVATPAGRILDLANMKVFDHCHMVAMDVADKLLSAQVCPVIEKLLQLLPETRILMASATFPMTLINFTKGFMADACQIDMQEQSGDPTYTDNPAEDVEAGTVWCKRNHDGFKMAWLLDLWFLGFVQLFSADFRGFFGLAKYYHSSCQSWLLREIVAAICWSAATEG